MALMTHNDEQKSLVDLLKELRDESTALVRQEVALAKTELSEKASRVGRNTGYLAVGGGIAFAGVLFLLVGLTLLLAVGLAAIGLASATALWLSFVIVGGVILLIGFGLVSKAIATLKMESLVPERTVDSLKENEQWARNKIA